MYFTKIKSGNTEIISNGTVISYNQNPIELKIGEDNEYLILIFDFIDDLSKNESPKMEGIAEGIKLTLKLANFVNPLGGGSNSPIRIGTFKNKAVYLNFRVYQLSGNNPLKSDKTLDYTIYLSEEV